MKTIITILLLTSLTTYGQRVIIHEIKDSAFMMVTGGKLEMYKGKNEAIDTMNFIIYGVVQQPLVKSELCRFTPSAYKDIIQTDGAVTSVQQDTKIESTRQFENDGEITFKFNLKDSINGAIASLTVEDYALGLRMHRLNGKQTISFVVNGGWGPTQYTGAMVNTKWTYKIKRTGVFLSFQYSADGKTFKEFGTAGTNYLAIGPAWFTGFIAGRGDGFTGVTITAENIKNK